MAQLINVQDATVVNKAYQTSANARPQKLDNGWIVTAEYSSESNPTSGINETIYLQVDKRDGQGFVPLCFVTDTSSAKIQPYFSLASKGTRVFLIFGRSTTQYFYVSIDATTQANVDVYPRNIVDTAQSAIGNVSLTINPQGTELHAAWASKNSTYPNSFNIRYAKGTIGTDGSVTWGAVEQVTTWNGTNDTVNNPSIILFNGNPMIFFNGLNMIGLLTKVFATKTGAFASYVNASWGHVNVQPSTGYVQSSPSAIFVPQSVNGLANGRIWVAWHGSDAQMTTANIRVSYSDDGGATWSTMEKLTTVDGQSQWYPSITANKLNEIFILWQGQVSSTWYTRNIKRIGTSWGTISNIKSGGNNPSSIIDLSLNFTEPLFIYKDTTKVGFYGTWHDNPIKPTAPTTFTGALPDSVKNGDTVNLAWTGATTEAGETLTYKVAMFNERTKTETTLANNVATANAAITMPSIAGLTNVKFRVYAYDGYDYSETYLESNSIPLTGTMLFDVQDATVVNSAYQTSASARPQMLSNGWIVTVEKTTASPFDIYLQVNKQDGNGFVPLCSVEGLSSGFYFSIAKKGTDIYLTANNSSNLMLFKINALTQTNVNIYSTYQLIDSGQSSLNGIDILVNNNDIHFVESSKNSTYPNSFNIRYAKGTINADGSVTWGAVEQVTNVNSTTYPNAYLNPSLSIKDNIPIIIAESQGIEFINSGTGISGGTNKRSILVLKRSRDLLSTLASTHAEWSATNVYVDTNSYIQQFPTAISIPQEIAIKNPLFASATQGVLAVAWQGVNAAQTGYPSLYFAYSLDGGVTWTVALLLQGSNSPVLQYTVPSLTAKVSGRLDIVFDYNNVTTGDVAYITNANGTWGNAVIIKDRTVNAQTFPSALYDPYMDYSDPLFIYKDAAKVGFYGIWPLTDISVPSGELGQVANKDSILKYAVATGGTMGQIVEKVNGVVVGTKNPTSGQALTVGLTPEQWDAVTFGKYQRQKNEVLTENFVGKIQGSDVENPHNAKFSTTATTLLAPTAFTSELRTEYYPNIEAIDTWTDTTSNWEVGGIAQMRYAFNVIAAVERKLGTIPGATVAAKVQWLKNNIAKFTGNWHGRGVSSTGNKANFTIYDVSTSSYHTAVTTSNGVISKLIKTATTLSANHIDPNGFVYYLAHAEPSDGVTASQIITEYVELLIELKPTTDFGTQSNILTIEMGANKWEYPFDKRLTVDADVLSVAKAVKDSNEVQLPAIKKMLGDKFELDANLPFEDIINNIPMGKKIAEGTSMTTGSTAVFQLLNSTTTITTSVLEVGGLDFKPSFIIAYAVGNQVTTTLYRPGMGNYLDMFFYISNITTSGTLYTTKATTPAYVNNTGFKIPVAAGDVPFNWIAIE